MNWRIEHDTGRIPALRRTRLGARRCRSANELATHLAFALRELDALRHQIATDRMFALLGAERY